MALAEQLNVGAYLLLAEKSRTLKLAVFFSAAKFFVHTAQKKLGLVLLELWPAERQ